MKWTSTALVVVLSMVLGGAVIGGVDYARNDGGTKTVVATDSGAQNPVGALNASNLGAASSSVDFTALYDAVRPSIVEITTGSAASDTATQRGGLGSGIVIDSDGHILTNYHVVSGFSTVTITFADGTTAQATVTGKDTANDVAVVKTDADASELHPAKLGDSSAVKIGSVVAAIGNPFELAGSLTTGVISGLDRHLPSAGNGPPMRGLLQTDAAVNPGNSGGALFNADGEVIGINTAIQDPGNQLFAGGIAYAVPINTPKRILSQLESGTAIGHAQVGISGRSLTPAEAKTLNIDGGVAVITVPADGAAAKAGLKAAPSPDAIGDVITAIDGTPVKSIDELASYVDGKNVGDDVKLSVHRDGKDIEITATLQPWNSAA